MNPIVGVHLIKLNVYSRIMSYTFFHISNNLYILPCVFNAAVREYGSYLTILRASTEKHLHLSYRPKFYYISTSQYRPNSARSVTLVVFHLSGSSKGQDVFNRLNKKKAGAGKGGEGVWFPCNLCHIVIFCILYASTNISYTSLFNLKTIVGI